MTVLSKRATFNKLHEELSLLRNEIYPRYQLWGSVMEYGFDPENLEPEEAAIWCRDNGFLNLAGKMRRYDPTIETPEEIFARICGL